MNTISQVCEFCLGENKKEELPFAEVLEQISYRYINEEHTLSGKACQFCIEFLLNDDHDSITDLVIGEVQK